jgi:hypothetical protein
MQRAIIFALLLFLPAILHAGVINWEGKPLAISVSTERLTRVEFPETLRSVFLSRSDIAVEKEDRSLYVRALAPEIEDILFAVRESGMTYEKDSDGMNRLSIIDNLLHSLLSGLHGEASTGVGSRRFVSRHRARKPTTEELFRRQ